MGYSFFKKGMAALAAIACTCGVSVAGAAWVGSLVASDNYNLYWGGSYANVTNTGSSRTTGYNTALGKGTSAGMSVDKNWTGEYTTTTSQTYSYGMAWGNESRAANNLATAFGLKSVATGVKATAFGEKTLASGETATAFGHLTTASGDRATAFGYSTTASGIASTAFGAESTASGQSSVAFGQKTTASGEAATAFGQESVASGRSAVAMGEHSEAKATNSLAALGGTTMEGATGSAAIGIGAVATGENSVALGNGAEATLTDSVALGSGAVADRTAGQDGYLKTDERTGAAWTATANAISIGNVNAVDDDGNAAPVTRQIIGVAAGSQATDAVNVAQLEAATKGLATETKLKATDDKVTALNGQVGTLNTQVGVLNTLAGEINTQVGALNTQVGTLNTVTGELTSHVGLLDTRVTTLDGRLDSVDTQLDTLNSQVESVNNRVDNVNTRVNQLDSRINKVGAHAAALAALHPLDYDPAYRWDFAAGVGNYKDANAMAVGAFYRPNGITMFSVGTTFGGSGSMVNAGISLKVGPGVNNGTTRSNLLDTVQNLKAENEALKARDNAQDSIIAQLRQELDALKASLSK